MRLEHLLSGVSSGIPLKEPLVVWFIAYRLQFKVYGRRRVSSEAADVVVRR